MSTVSIPHPVPRATATARRRPRRPDALPGLVLVAVLSAIAYGLNALVPVLSPLIWGVFLGMAVVIAKPLPATLQPGARVASRRLLRVGVALLGLRLVFGQMLSVGAPALAVLAVTIPATLGFTVWLGGRLGVSRDLSLLIATGSAICGASAIAAMDAATDSGEEDVTLAVATVTLFGTAALVVLPFLQSTLLHLSPAAFGTWVGASVHEVAQVVAAATPGGPAAVDTATIVKLTRVLLLAPLILAVVLWRRRRGEAAPSRNGRRSSPVPAFVVAFLGFAALASTGWVSAPIVSLAERLDVMLLTAALVGLGLGASLPHIVRLGWRPMAVGVGASVAAAVTSLGAVALLVH